MRFARALRGIGGSVIVLRRLDGLLALLIGMILTSLLVIENPGNQSNCFGRPTTVEAAHYTYGCRSSQIEGSISTRERLTPGHPLV